MSRMFEIVFRGGKSDWRFPKVEPAQNFSCGVKGFQERVVIFLLYVFVGGLVVISLPSILVRLLNQTHHARVNYDLIDSFSITCSGCKIQITNDMKWAGLFSPSNFIIYLPMFRSMLLRTPFKGIPPPQDGFPSFCNKLTRSCDVVLGNNEAFIPATDPRWFTEVWIRNIYIHTYIKSTV